MYFFAAVKVEPTSPPPSSQGDLERSRSLCIDRSSKPYEYLKNVPKNDDELHIIKGCIVTLATKLSVNTSTVESFFPFQKNIFKPNYPYTNSNGFIIEAHLNVSNF